MILLRPGKPSGSLCETFCEQDQISLGWGEAFNLIAECTISISSPLYSVFSPLSFWLLEHPVDPSGLTLHLSSLEVRRSRPLCERADWRSSSSVCSVHLAKSQHFAAWILVLVHSWPLRPHVVSLVGHLHLHWHLNVQDKFDTIAGGLKLSNSKPWVYDRSLWVATE